MPIASDMLVIAAPNTEHFRKKYAQEPDLPELMKEPFIMRTEQSGTQWEAEKLLRRLQLTDKDLNIVARVNNAHALQSYVSQGVGIAIVSYRMVKTDEQQGKLLVIHLGEHVDPREFYLVFQDSPYLCRSAAAFIQLVKKALESHQL